MHAALTDISQGGLLGDVEPLLFYGFWNPTSGDLDIGTIHGHLSQNRVNFGGSHSEMQANYGNAWAAFAERPIVQESSVIPRHAFGVPVFPSIVLNIVTPADTQVLLTEYWSHLWAHSWPADSNYPPIPWEAIANNPSGYYDTMRFNLPVPLIAPQRLNTLHTTDSPFIFYPKHQHPTEEETVSRPELGGLGTISNESNSGGTGRFRDGYLDESNHGEPGGASEPVHTPVLDESNSGEPGGASEPVHTPVLDESNSGGPGGASQTIHTSAPHDLNLKKFNAVHTPVPLAESTGDTHPNCMNFSPTETGETVAPQDIVQNLKRSKQVLGSLSWNPDDQLEIVKPRKKKIQKWPPTATQGPQISRGLREQRTAKIDASTGSQSVCGRC
ncbi:hypothetical protein B0H10DRAFT_2200041 [Mycena sp. CBHHK59/15]|nr:hypothetical protein B0H10DRAFT_2200041 [Mycena sp. CBHHK59/15]